MTRLEILLASREKLRDSLAEMEKCRPVNYDIPRHYLADAMDKLNEAIRYERKTAAASGACGSAELAAAA